MVKRPQAVHLEQAWFVLLGKVFFLLLHLLLLLDASPRRRPPVLVLLKIERDQVQQLVVARQREDLEVGGVAFEGRLLHRLIVFCCFIIHRMDDHKIGVELLRPHLLMAVLAHLHRHLNVLDRPGEGGKVEAAIGRRKCHGVNSPGPFGPESDRAGTVLARPHDVVVVADPRQKGVASRVFYLDVPHPPAAIVHGGGVLRHQQTVHHQPPPLEGVDVVVDPVDGEVRVEFDLQALDALRAEVVVAWSVQKEEGGDEFEFDFRG